MTKEELEKEIAKLKDELKALRESTKDYGAGCYENGLRNGKRAAKKDIEQLEAQIEKMKNCKNCKELKKEKDGLLFCAVGSFYTNIFGKNCDKWEMAND